MLAFLQINFLYIEMIETEQGNTECGEKFPQSPRIFPFPGSWRTGKETPRRGRRIRVCPLQRLHEPEGWACSAQSLAIEFVMSRAKQRLPRRSDPSESAPPLGSLCTRWKSLQGVVCAVVVSISTASFFSSSFSPSSPQHCQLRWDFHDASRSLPHLHCLALNKTLKFPEPTGMGGKDKRDNYGPLKCIRFPSI